MEMSILVRPVSWHKMPSKPIIEMFGYTSDGRSIYVQIQTCSTYILRFNQPITDTLLDDVNEVFRPVSIKKSEFTPNILIVRTPEPISGNPKWIEMVKDPYGDIESLWEARGLSPYEWLALYRYTPLPGKYTTADLNISVIEEDVFNVVDELEDVPLRYMFANFDDKLSQVEIITLHLDEMNSYIITHDRSLLSFPSGAVIIDATSEDDLFVKFFALYNTFRPDRYMCKSNDPLLTGHVEVNDKHKRACKINLLQCHDIEDLELNILSMESVNDTLETLCNNICVNIDTFLYDDVSNIIHKVVYNVDPGSVFATGEIENPQHIHLTSPGIYRNVYVYSYGELYRNIMLTSTHLMTVILAEYLEHAPSPLISKMFYSHYVERSDLSSLEEILDNIDTISIGEASLMSLHPLTVNWAKQIKQLPCYVALNSESSLTLEEDGTIDSVGISLLSRISFDLLRDVIREYLLNSSVSMENMENIPIEKFIMTERITTLSKVSEGQRIRQILTSQYGSTITGWLTVKYVMTTKGPLLLELFGKDDMLDYDYYRGEVRRYVDNLRVLEVK